MPTFIDMSNLTKRSTLTGNEEFQVSATEKVTSQQIADLASSGLNVYTISESESQNQKIDASRVEELKKSELVLFPNEGSYTPYFKVSVDDSKAYFITGNIPINSQGQPGLNNGEEPPFEQIQTVMIEVDLTTYDITIQPYPVISKSWFKGDVSVIEITDFAIPSVNITKDGQSFLFYANDASNIPNNNHGATSFVGVAIASPIFITGDQRLLYYMMVDTARSMFYTGRANLEDDTVGWNNTPVTRLGQAVHVTAFTESALSSLLYTYKAGDFIPFYTSSVTASEANQFPESGVFNGFISMGSNEGDYFQIFAFKSGSPNAYMGACIGSTTQWTKVSGGDSSKGTEDLKNWTTPTYVGANAGAGTGDYVDFLLTRALKSTDVILVTWRKQSASVKDVEIAGHAIFNPGAYSQDCCLDLLEDYQGNGDYYGLFLNQVTSEVGANMLTLYAESEGNSYGPQYLITGIYNISGK